MMNAVNPEDEMPMLTVVTLENVIECRDTLVYLAACGAVYDGPYLHDLLHTLQQIVNVECKKTCQNYSPPAEPTDSPVWPSL